MTILSLDSVSKAFQARDSSGSRASVKAVQGVSFEVRSGESVAIVGESGCGKSTTARLILGLEKPDSGRILLNPAEPTGSKPAVVRAVFQNPRSSLNPRRRVAGLMKESIGTRLKELDRDGVRELINSTLAEVGLSEEHARAFPHQLSGGQQQRVAIAAAVIAEPDLIVLDEPTSSLDVSIAAQILNLLVNLQTRRNSSYIVITHDLSTARFIASRVAVMYLGRIVEEGRIEDVLETPAHPYTQALVGAEPPNHPSKRRDNLPLIGELPSTLNVPPGCSYHPRCSRNDGEICIAKVPMLEQVSTHQSAACFYPIVDYS